MVSATAPVGEAENQSKQGASRYLIFNRFGGMDTQSSRIDLPVEKQAWLENVQPVAENVLRGVPAPAGTIYTLTGETVVRTFSSIIIKGTEYVIAFCASGAAYAATVAFNGYDQPIIGSSVVFIAPAGTFSATGGDVVDWNAKRILIADSVAGYSTWDGNLFVRQGNASPNIAVTNGGFGYTNGANATLIIVRTTFTITAPGAGYVNGATVAITGGSGTGMTAVALVIAGAVVAINQTSPGQGYLPGDTLTVTISPVSGGAGATATATVASAPGTAPTASVQVSQGIVTGLTLTGAGAGLVAADGITVTITGIGGAGSGATAIAHPWPFITPFPTTLAVAFGRVWLGSGRTLVVTGTGSLSSGEGYDDFNLADASVTTTIQDADLINQITALRYLNNYLYILGDNSVKSIGGITVTNSVTAFSIITLTSDQGTVFPNSVISFNRLILFANTVGVHAVFGASVEKVSGPMDGIFRLADFSQPLQAAVNDLNNIHTYLLLIRYRDPLAPGERSLLLAYMDRKWFAINQGNSVASICTAVINGVTTTFASSGSDLTQILQNKSAGVPFKISTSLSSNGDPINAKRFIRAGLGQTSDACPDIDLIAESAELPQVETNFQAGSRPLTFVNNNGQILTFVNNSNQVLTFVSNGFTANWSGKFSQHGRWIGLTATGTINAQQIHILWAEYQPDVPVAFVPCTPLPPIPPPVSNPITPPQPAPPPVSSPLLWVPCDSCHIVAFSLNASLTGNVAPIVNLQGSKTQLTEPITLNSNDSFTAAACLDTSGNLYSLNLYQDDAPGTTVTFYPATPTRNQAPTRTLGGTLTGLPNAATIVGSGLEVGGICIGATGKIYVGAQGKVSQFAAGASGNTAPLLTTSPGGTIEGMWFDPINAFVWVAFQSGTQLLAFDETLTQQRNITGAATGLTGNFDVWVDSSGLIYTVNNDFVNPPSVLIFSANANGNAAPTRTITGAATMLTNSNPAGGVTGSDGTIYVVCGHGGSQVGTLPGGSYLAQVLVFAPGSSGNVAPTAVITGANAHIDLMDDGTLSRPVGAMIGPLSTIQPPYAAKATKFTAASITSAGLFSANFTSRFGLVVMRSWSQGGVGTVRFGNTGGHGFLIRQELGGRIMRLFDSTGTLIVTATETTNKSNPHYYQDAISWDTTTQTLQWFVAGQASSHLSVVWASSNNVGYTTTDTWQLGDTGIASTAFSQVYASVKLSSLFDLTVAANLAKISTGADAMTGDVFDHPVNLGSNGQSVLGSMPDIYFDASGAGMTTNLGTAGSFSLAAGSLADAMNYP